RRAVTSVALPGPSGRISRTVRCGHAWGVCASAADDPAKAATRAAAKRTKVGIAALTKGSDDSERRALFNHDLDLLAGLRRLAVLNAVYDQEALEWPVRDRHMAGELFGGVAGLNSDDLDAQRLGGGHFRQAQPTERVHRFAERAVDLGGLRFG